jgi:hypothetical protein
MHPELQKEKLIVFIVVRNSSNGQENMALETLVRCAEVYPYVSWQVPLERFEAHLCSVALQERTMLC